MIHEALLFFHLACLDYLNCIFLEMDAHSFQTQKYPSLQASMDFHKINSSRILSCDNKERHFRN